MKALRRMVLPFVLALAGLLAGLAGGAEPITLRVSTWDGDIALKTMRELTKSFERENPGVRVKLESYPDYSIYHQKMMITYAAGVAPDVALMDPNNFQRLARRGALMPLNPFFERTPGFDIKAYYPEIVKAHSYKGTCYVLPRDIAPIGILYYDRQAFLDAGLGDPKTYDKEWTWDLVPHPERGRLDFLTVCARLMKRSGGKTTRWAFAGGWPDLVAQSAAIGMGGDPVDDPEEPKRITTDDPRWVAGYQYTADLIGKWGYMPSTTETASVLMATTTQLFIQRKIAMFQDGIWEVPNMRRDIKPGTKEYFDWDVCLAPGFWNGGRPTRRYLSGGSGFSVFSSTEHPEESWRLARYLSGEPGMTAMAKAGVAQPAIAELARRPGVWVPGPATPASQLMPRNRIATDEAVPFTHWTMTYENGKTVGDRMGKGLELVWTGQRQPKEILLQNRALAQNRLDALRREETLPPFRWGIGLLVGIAIVGGILAWVYGPEVRARRSGERMTLHRRGEARAAYKFLSPWLIGLAAFTLGPMVLSLLMAFADWDVITPARFRGFGNFREAFTDDPSFWPSLWVTLKYTTISVPLGIAGALGLALLLNQKVRGVAVYRSLYYIPSIASAVAASLIWRRVLNPESGLLNTLLYGTSGHSWIGERLSAWAGTPGKPVDWLGNDGTALPALIIMSVWGIGGGMVIFLAGLQGIPQYYYEAATLDGAGAIGRFRNVTLPLLTPTIFFTLITGLIGSLQVFTQAFVMTGGGPNDATRFFVFHLYQNAFDAVRMGYASALGWVLFGIVLVFTLIQVKGSKWVYYEADAR